MFLENIALRDDHPDDEDQHDCIPHVVHDCPQSESLQPADQAAEGVVKCVGSNSYDIPERHSNDLDENIAAHSGNSKSNACEGSKEWVHHPDQSHAHEN